MKLLKTQIDEITWKIGVFTKDGNFPLGEIVATRNTDSRFEFDFNYPNPIVSVYRSSKFYNGFIRMLIYHL